MDDPVDNKPPTFWQMLHSVMAAAFGVQSGKNRARDFTHGKPESFRDSGDFIHRSVRVDPGIWQSSSWWCIWPGFSASTFAG